MITSKVRGRLSPEAHIETLNFQIFRSVSTSPIGSKVVDKGTQTPRSLRRISPRKSLKHEKRKLSRKDRGLQELAMRLEATVSGCETRVEAEATFTPKLGRNKDGFGAKIGEFPLVTARPKAEMEIRPPTFGRVASPSSLEGNQSSPVQGLQSTKLHRSTAKVPLPPLVDTPCAPRQPKYKRAKRSERLLGLQSPGALSQQYLALMAATENYISRVHGSSKRLPASHSSSPSREQHYKAGLGLL